MALTTTKDGFARVNFSFSIADCNLSLMESTIAIDALAMSSDEASKLTHSDIAALFVDKRNLDQLGITNLEAKAFLLDGDPDQAWDATNWMIKVAATIKDATKLRLGTIDRINAYGEDNGNEDLIKWDAENLLFESLICCTGLPEPYNSGFAFDGPPTPDGEFTPFEVLLAFCEGVNLGQKVKKAGKIKTVVSRAI